MKLLGMISDEIESLFSKTATVSYPKKEYQVPERFHGLLDYDPSKCVGCSMCMRDCPAATIHIYPVDRKNKQFVMSYNIGQCCYCKQCVLNCKFNALSMTNKGWESASLYKKEFQLYFGTKENINKVLEQQAAKSASKAEEKAE